jgi:DNA-binding PadR family transcriptional regulator
VAGKVRKYYTITSEGEAVLADARQKIHELVDEVLEGHGPASLADLPGLPDVPPDHSCAPSPE